MADRTIATIQGTMLVPGVSRNRRLYTPALIAKTVKRMQERIADPTGLPIVMRTHHSAGDDSQLIVGRVTSVKTDEAGKAKYSADLYDTGPGKDIATLTTSDQPALRSVSIHGYWLGPVKRVQHEGDMVETADDLEIDAVDFTATPGVVGALLDIGTHETRESTVVRTAISESLEATVAVVADDVPEASLVEAADPKEPYGNVQYADPGYQADKKKRYPLDTEDHIRAAWSYINQGKNADLCTAKQLKRVKDRIRAAMKKIGADVSSESATTRWGELREYYPDGPDGAAGFCVDAYNGPLSITMRACGIDPADLRAVAAAAMSAACDALQTMDPDMDADIDLPGAPAEDTDGDGGKPKAKAKGETLTLDQYRAAIGEHAVAEPPIPISPSAATESHPANQAGVSTNTQEVPAVSEATTAETTAATTRTLSDDDLKAMGAIFSAALKETVAPLVATLGETTKAKKDKAATSETAAPAAESTTKAGKSAKKQLKETAAELATLKESLQAELKTVAAETVAAERTRMRDELREELLRDQGIPPRRGYRVHENDQTVELTDEQLFDHRADVLMGDFGKTPVPAQGTGVAPGPTGPTAVAR